MKFLFGFCLLFIALTAFSVESLPLSNAQIKKLQAYFPSEISQAQLSWTGTPLTIALPLTQEKRLIFPNHVNVDVKSALTADQLKIVNNDRSVYLTALKDFPVTRLYVTLEDSKEVVLVDIHTDAQANQAVTTISIQQNNTPIATSIINPENSVLSSGDTYVALTRYAWQQLYAPTSLLSNPNSITRVPMQTDHFISSLSNNGSVIAHPVASWSLNGYYITAIALRNAYQHGAHLKLAQDFCGQWLASSLYPRHYLKPLGDKQADSTTLFVISNSPFHKALEVCHAGA